MYFDNVGGEITEAVINRFNIGGRMSICGQISGYNSETLQPGPRNWINILVKRLKVQGFIVFDYQARAKEAFVDMSKWMAEGKLQHKNHIVDGLENAVSSLKMLFSGENKGKMIVTVYNKELSIFIKSYINKFYDNTELNLAPWKKISNKYDLKSESFDLIIDTQKSVRKTLALKRISSKCFISGSAKFLFSSIKPKSAKKSNQYYLNDLFELLSLYSGNIIKNDFKLEVPNQIKKTLGEFFSIENKYFGIAPGAGQENKIWKIENYIKLAKHFQNQGFKIVKFGNDDVNNIPIDYVIKQSEKVIDLID